MKVFNVIAISGGCVAEFVQSLVVVEMGSLGSKKRSFRGYMDPSAPTIEVDEEKMTVNYNGEIHKFCGYRAGIHGNARTVTFKVREVLIEAYTDTPTHSGTNSEEIRAALKRRKEDPGSGY
jgi:hypothetical protein